MHLGFPHPNRRMYSRLVVAFSDGWHGLADGVGSGRPMQLKAFTDGNHGMGELRGGRGSQDLYSKL